MKCPLCKEKIEAVNVYSRQVSTFPLEGKKLSIFSYDDEILETISIECPECQGDLKKYVKE